MFFQELSPPIKLVKTPKVEKKKDDEETTVISLAPFTHNPKVCFEDVPIGVSITKKLHIINPTKNDIELFITKGPPDERNLCYTWVQMMVPLEKSVFLELTWCPKQVGSWRDILTFQDASWIKKDIPLIFKSVASKKLANKSKKLIKPISAKIKPITAQIKSPTKKQLPTFKTSPLKKRSSPPRIRISPARVLKQKTQETSSENIQCNPPISKRSPKMYYSPFKESANTIKTQHRQQYYDINDKENVPNSTFTIKSPNMNFSQCSMDSIKSPPLQSTLNYTPNLRAIAKFNNLHLTPIMDNFSPSNCSTGEKPLDATYNCSLNRNLSDAFIKSPESLVSVSDGLLSEKNTKSTNSTYVKEKGDVGNCLLKDLEEDLKTVDFNGCVEVLSRTYPKQPERFLDMIMEESHVESESEESYSRQSNRKRKSVGLVENTSKQSNVCEFGPTPVKRRSIKSGLNLQRFIAKSREFKENAESIFLHDPDEHLKNSLQNPYLLATTSEVDPFLSITSYYEPRWLDEQEIRFKKWLNVILTPPESLRSDADAHPVNIAKIWQECKRCEVEKAPTKEEISNKVAVRGTLLKLRESAVKLFRTPEISQVLSKLAVLVENGKILIRPDKNVHLDLGLQQDVMVLFLNYNPLWLRVGLETIFGHTMKLHSNSDIIGISYFIMSNFFKDACLLKKYKHARDDKYKLEIKKHILKKFLMLIYFLDVAKEKRLIPYDPCLFCKNAPFKESKEVLCKFISILFSAVGDIKSLKQIGYILNHKQTHIHEFDYAVNSIGADLRDGVRLTRVMEVILLRQNLIQLMRVPAISRLQKIHNVKVAFTALQEADYIIQQDITPKDIVDGHREKTMSLLWQIIYKFQAPLIKKSIITIQRWWNSLLITIKRRILKRKHEKFINAANKIQSYYLGWKLMQSQRAQYINILKAIHILQTWFRSKLEMLKTRRSFLTKRSVVIKIQRKFRARKIGLEQRKIFLAQKKAAVIIQCKFRATLLMNQTRQNYFNIRESVIKIQTFYRAKLDMQVERKKFLLMKQSVITIENWWISYKLMIKQRTDYKKLRRAVIVVQTRFRAILKMQTERDKYTRIKQATILIQRWYKTILFMRAVRKACIKRRSSVLLIQNKYQAYKLMKVTKEKFLLQKNAAIKIQKYYRGYLLMKLVRLEFISLKKSVLYVEEKRAAVIKARTTRLSFLKLKKAAIFMQRKFRANRICKSQRAEYLRIHEAVVRIQIWYRKLRLVRKYREDFKKKKSSVVIVQRFFRGWLEMRRQVEIKKSKLRAIMGLQRYIRGFLLRREMRELTDPEVVLKRKMKKAAITIQATWRGYAVRMSQSKEIDIIRQRFQTVNEDFSAQKTIGIKKDLAMKILANKNSTYIQTVNALEHIEYLTRRHKDYCRSLSETLPEMIAILIITSGRSDPDKIACIRGANILINFIKYPPSSQNAWLPDHIKGIIKTMTHWCDKESSVFPLLSTVIWLYTQNKSYLRFIKLTPNLKQLFVKMLQLCERKQKMMTHAKRNPTLNEQFSTYKGLPLPSLTPDWGLDLKKKPRAFTNSMHAINTLMNELGLN